MGLRLLFALLPLSLFAQAPGVPVYREGPGSHPQAAIKKELRKLKQGSALLPMNEVAKQITRASCTLTLPAPATTKLDNRELWRRARAAHIRVGWYYLCQECNKWHVDLSGGYAITEDVVATCGHVVGTGREEDMREGYLIAVDEDDHVYPVTEILAMNRGTDSAILRVKGPALKPLPLGNDVVPGDAVVCFSDPLDRRGVFTTGVVNRFMQRPFLRKEELTDEQREHPDRVPAPVFLQVSADWAPGSSGSAVLDQCGNVIGHVSEVQTELDDSGDDLAPPPSSNDGGKKDTANKNDAKPETSEEAQVPGTVIVFHDAIAASNVQALIKPTAAVK